MISRYALYETALLKDRFDLNEGLPKGIKPHYNIYPTMEAPIVIKRGESIVAERMKWGLMAKGATDVNSIFRYKTFNVPSEKILSKHSWETAIRQNRCLVPANGFYIMTENQGIKHASYVKIKDQSLFALAGIYRSWQDPSGEEYGTYSVITIDSVMSNRMGSQRMPIIIRRDEESRWIDPAVNDVNSLYDMLRAYSTEQLDITEVSARVFSSKEDNPEFIVSIK